MNAWSISSCENLKIKAAAAKFASVRLIAPDIKQMVSFYEMVTGLIAEWLAPVFAEIVTLAATLAIDAAETVSSGRSVAPNPEPCAPHP